MLVWDRLSLTTSLQHFRTSIIVVVGKWSVGHGGRVRHMSCIRANICSFGASVWGKYWAHVVDKRISATTDMWKLYKIPGIYCKQSTSTEHILQSSNIELFRRVVGVDNGSSEVIFTFLYFIANYRNTTLSNWVKLRVLIAHKKMNVLIFCFVLMTNALKRNCMSIFCSITCPKISREVCGTDMQTYGTFSCSFKLKETCHSFLLGIVSERMSSGEGTFLHTW
jgi:hypothetical protein